MVEAVRERDPLHPVIIVGAGPVGLCLALALAKQGLRSLVLESRETISHGSRAVCISQRSLDILDRLGVADRFRAKAFAWSSGKTYYRDRLILEFEMPCGDGLVHPPMVNLQQPYIEQYLYDAALASGLVDVRWRSSVTALRQHDDHVALDIAGPGDVYTTRARYVVGCDGARSFVRSSLGLRLSGTSYEGRYVIADIRMPGEQQGRRVWFDPPSNPGSTVIMHCQPDDVVRVDYQLADGEDAEIAPERVRARVKAHLDWIGETRAWELVWVSIYKAHSRTLEEYVHDRVLFAGDAAHLVPIFGVRGLNSGLEDANNLAWKLADVIVGSAGPDLLQTYSRERVAAARENMRQAEKSAGFMTPPGRGQRLLRDAVLSLAVQHDFIRHLVNPRQVMPMPYQLDEGRGGSIAGTPCPNSIINGGSSLYAQFGSGFTLLLFGHQAAPQHTFARLAIVPVGGAALPNEDGRLRRLFDVDGDGAVLIRPDAYIAGRWLAPGAAALHGALTRHLSGDWG